VLPGGPVPDALARLGRVDSPLALTVGNDGHAAVAFALDEKTSAIRWVGAGDEAPREVELAGWVRSLLFGPEGRELLAVVRRERKRGRGETYLARFATASGDAEPNLALPAGARGMDLAETGLLVVACEEEIRTFRMPALTSGPLYRLPGENWTVATLPDGDRLLVGRAEGLVLVDLDDAQTIDGLPVRDRVELGAPIVGLAVAPDGTRAVARAADGRIFEVTFDPLRAVGTGSGDAIAWPGVRKRSSPPAELVVVDEEEQTQPPAPAIEEPPAVSPPPAIPVERDEPAPPPPASPVQVSIAPPPVPTSSESRAVSVRGRVTGPAVGLVAAVVILGPDNVMREAARVRPAENGSWAVEDLAPGGYRIVVQGASGRVLETRPPFATARVEAGSPAEVGPIEVVRGY